MRIIVDENVLYGREAFGSLGDVQTAPGRAITRETLAGADALVVRSITKVNEALLEGTPVRFVGTCTIGEDHIDKACLRKQNIAFSSAPGSNANSVGEYIVAAMLVLAERYRRDLSSMRLGIVGVGNVGSNVHAKAAALGMTCVLNDPPLAEATGDPNYRPLDEALDCDIVTFHVPLQKTGPHPTWHLVDAALLRRMRPGAFLINSSRGPVVDGAALKAALKEEHLAGAVLDVWEGEPQVDTELLDLVDVATPHIAGYSFDGKVNGTRQIYEALCRSLNLEGNWTPEGLLPTPEAPELRLEGGRDVALAAAVRAVYDIMADDAALRRLSSLPATERGAYFDRLRKEYPRRREFFNTRVHIQLPSAELGQILAGLGFIVRQ